MRLKKRFRGALLGLAACDAVGTTLEFEAPGTFGGKLIAIEENGNNIIQRLKLYKQRGNNRIIDYYDEGLGRTVTMGNENIRPYAKWRSEFVKAGFEMEEDKLNYVRLFPPRLFQRKQPKTVVKREQELWQRYGLLREYFFFGVNFVARKP